MAVSCVPQCMYYKLTCYRRYALQTHVLNTVCITDSRATRSMHYRLTCYMQYALQTCALHAVCITDSHYVIIQDQAVVAAAPERESRMGQRRRCVGQREDSDPGFGRAGSHPPGSGELLERCDFWEDHSAGCVMTSEVKIVIPVSFWWMEKRFFRTTSNNSLLRQHDCSWPYSSRQSQKVGVILPSPILPSSIFPSSLYSYISYLHLSRILPSSLLFPPPLYSSICPQFFHLPSILPSSVYSSIFPLFFHLSSILPSSLYSSISCLFFHLLSILPSSVYSSIFPLFFHLSSILPSSLYSSIFCLFFPLFFHLLSILPSSFYSSIFPLFFHLPSTLPSSLYSSIFYLFFHLLWICRCHPKTLFEFSLVISRRKQFHPIQIACSPVVCTGHSKYVSCINPFTPELKKCILPTFQKAIVWVM